MKWNNMLIADMALAGNFRPQYNKIKNTFPKTMDAPESVNI